jgi:hypothetical protein
MDLKIDQSYLSLRQQGNLRFIVADFRPQGENQQRKDDSYRLSRWT